jgi:hypothetical protein
MRTHNLYRLFIAVSSTLVLLTVAFITASIIPVVDRAFATAPNPSWWVDNNGSFSQYDDYQYKNGRTWQGNYYPGTISLDSGVDSYLLSTNASYDGVAAIGPRPLGDNEPDVNVYFTSDANASQENEWECTELVKRFLYLEYGVRSIPAYGYQVVDNYSSPTLGYPSQFYKIPNDGNAKLYPKPGDVLSYNSVGGDAGHTALVQSVTNQSSGSATVQLIEQNASGTGLTYQTFSNWQFQNGIDDDVNNSHTVRDWLTPLKWINNSPSGTTKDDIYAMAASSATNVWAAGQEKDAIPNFV